MPHSQQANYLVISDCC